MSANTARGEAATMDDTTSTITPATTPPTDTEETGLSNEQLEQIWAWNTPVPPTLDYCMHSTIKERAAAHPERFAVQSWDGDFRYGDVDAKSDAFARHLASSAVGVKPGDIVPLCFEKSRWTVVAVLAVMKAGAAFALTDPSQPEGRLRTIVETTGASVVVTSAAQRDLGARIAPDGVGVVALDEDLLLQQASSGDGSGSGSGGVDDLPPVSPRSNLYIQFTSGSTGKPKGVVITHANYTSGAVPRAAAVGYHAGSRVLDFASYAFDVSIDCMLCTLAAGGCLCVASEAARVDDLSGAIRGLAVNMAHMTPSVARVLDPDIVPALQVLGLGGEAIAAGDAAAWARHPRTTVVNAYGPSECTVGCAVNRDVAAERRKPHVTIGRGVGGALWIVDPADHRRLLPVGAVGELLVEGPIVGPGYLRDPAKTAEVFVSDPPKWLLAGSPRHPGRSGRLYKTGDLVRYDEAGDGTVVFVGRADQQVKLRGQRIELAEIEHNMLEALPAGTRVAAEVIRPAGASEPTLVAFVAESAGPVPPAEGLLLLGGAHSAAVRAALRDMDRVLARNLPVYMLPAAYVPLRTLPLLVSAKTDRKRLRELGAALGRRDLARFASAALAPARRAPASPMETHLAALWAQVLGGPGDAAAAELSAGDNFFAVGGDSLRAMKLVAAARARGVGLSVAAIFRHPVLSDMAGAATAIPADDGATCAAAPEIPPFSLISSSRDWPEPEARADCAALCGVPADRVEDAYPCTPLQEGLMALSAKIPEAYVAQRVVELPSAAAARDLAAAFAAVAAASPVLRTRVVQVPGRGLVQVVLRADDDDDDESACRWFPAHALPDYLVRDRAEPMGLGRPLVRYAAFASDEDDDNDDAEGAATAKAKAHFVLTMHHALYDGWSMPLVVERVNAVLAAGQQQQQQQPVPPPRPAEFKHFIAYLAQLDRRAGEDYWRETLRGAADVPQFPALPHEGYQTRADALLEHYAATGRPAGGVTMATVVRSAWALLVATYTAAGDVVFGETLTGRNAAVAGVEAIEGPMITTVPVRVGVDRGSAGSDLLRDVHRRAVDAIPHEHFGLQHIRRLGPDAREACELRTGLVMHPSASAGGGGGESEETKKEKQPADGFVPAGDAEAAQEALKFNTYALMLVCSLDPDGFHVMASFDSRTVGKPQMQRMLAQFGRLARALVQNPEATCGELADVLDEDDTRELRRLARDVAPQLASTGLLPADCNASEAWIVDREDATRLVPLGAVGELVVRCPDGGQGMDKIDQPLPSWAGDEQSSGLLLYRTHKLVRYDEKESKITPVTHTPKASAQLAPAKPPRQKRVPALSNRQQLLRRVWARNLGLEDEEEDIGPDDSFFQLGGDSIGAMKLVSELRAHHLALTVPEIFAHRTLHAMAEAIREQPQQPQQSQQQSTSMSSSATTGLDPEPFSLLGVDDAPAFVEQHVRPRLQHPDAWRILDVLPTRPLQDVAVRGTTELPRYSARYEIFHLRGGAVDSARLLAACRALVARHEILRTVFVRCGVVPGDDDDRCLAVVLESLDVPVATHQVAEGEDIDAFTHKLCHADIETDMPLGSPFVKFFLVRGQRRDDDDDDDDGNEKTNLVLRISHAQYDEICLVGLLRQLGALYNHNNNSPDVSSSLPPSPSVPFSRFVHHTLTRGIPASIPYWRTLLAGARLTRLRPPIPLTHRRPASLLARPADLGARRHVGLDVTAATFPTAAWALALARHLGGGAARDLVFGEVVSGRHLLAAEDHDLEGAAVMGPTWQYVPFRARLDEETTTTGRDLLRAVQRQHVAGAAHAGPGLGEIARACGTGWDPDAEKGWWFDSVVHQDVYHVEELRFGDGDGGAAARMETLYPHPEPLREWKVQAFVQGDRLTMEIVTFEEWLPVARVLLRELERALDLLLTRPDERLF
ncbi:acetyl-CoA synthetase-like protein [Xylariomycetidae sp. FL0641]|nr:acetyl-CoA synthetase-like protein [Xylariomycetidae sp. FL0641]